MIGKGDSDWESYVVCLSSGFIHLVNVNASPTAQTVGEHLAVPTLVLCIHLDPNIPFVSAHRNRELPVLAPRAWHKLRGAGT